MSEKFCIKISEEEIIDIFKEIKNTEPSIEEMEDISCLINCGCADIILDLVRDYVKG